MHGTCSLAWYTRLREGKPKTLSAPRPRRKREGRTKGGDREPASRKDNIVTLRFHAEDSQHCEDIFTEFPSPFSLARPTPCGKRFRASRFGTPPGQPLICGRKLC